jgi:hypothetical protein
MTGSGVIMKRLVIATAMSMAVLGGTCATSLAADLGPVTGKRHVRTGWHGYAWRDRCAYAGYYCLYAWDGYVYHYPFDDRPSDYRRHRYRFLGDAQHQFRSSPRYRGSRASY